MITIKVPCSSANIGPGFDVIGLALSLHLTVQVTYPSPDLSPAYPLNCSISYAQPTPGIPLNPSENLITRTALYVLRCHNRRKFPVPTSLLIDNPIPLGRGLGSSGAAVVAGVLLANELAGLGLTPARTLDYCLMVERHPDNVAAALYGGFVGTYLADNLDPAEMARAEIPLAEELPEPAGGEDTGMVPPQPPLGIGHYLRFAWAPQIKAVVVIPDFEVATHRAREVLPESYSRKDVIHNLSRLLLLPHLLAASPPSPPDIFYAMSDKMHQPYRASLIPGLTSILASPRLTPAVHPGLCGICLSGAGPTILALATTGFDDIATEILDHFSSVGVHCDWKLLDIVQQGASVLSD
ncbi:MAG: hypothetical protein M1825_003802 [Sarcosagium campestre]|nr:MAG: hypothetical protein M1825_003802 [Sarcosagium campestre]